MANRVVPIYRWWKKPNYTLLRVPRGFNPTACKCRSRYAVVSSEISASTDTSRRRARTSSPRLVLTDRFKHPVGKTPVRVDRSTANNTRRRAADAFSFTPRVRYTEVSSSSHASALRARLCRRRGRCSTLAARPSRARVRNSPRRFARTHAASSVVSAAITRPCQSPAV